MCPLFKMALISGNHQATTPPCHAAHPFERCARSTAVNLSTVIRGERFAFADLREVFAKSNEEKSGDQLAGLAARTERERVAAKLVLADLRLGEIVDNPMIDPDVDEVSRLICESLDRDTFAPVRGLTVGTLR